MPERDPLTGRYVRAGSIPAQEAPVSITEDSTTTGPATSADPGTDEVRDGRTQPAVVVAADAEGFLTVDGVQYVPRADLVAAEAELADDHDSDGAGALVHFRVRDTVTGSDLSGLGVVVRAAGEDNAAVRVVPLAPTALEVDAAALSPVTSDELAAR